MEAIYLSYYRRVWAYCARRLAYQQVEDAVADVFAIAWRRIDAVPDGDGALPWLYGVAFRVVSQNRRTAARHRSLSARLGGHRVESADGVEVQVVERWEYRRVRAAAERLSLIDREVLRLSLWEELSHAEVSQALGVSADAAKQRLHRAKKRLARHYEKLARTSDWSPDAQTGGDQ